MLPEQCCGLVGYPAPCFLEPHWIAGPARVPSCSAEIGIHMHAAEVLFDGQGPCSCCQYCIFLLIDVFLISKYVIALLIFGLDGEIDQCKFCFFDLCPIAMAQPIQKRPGDWELFEGAHRCIYWSTVAKVLAAPPRNHPETVIQRVQAPTSSRWTKSTSSMCDSEMSMQQLWETKWR